MDDIIVGKKDLLSSLYRFLRNVWNVICISWYDELCFITKRFRVTVDTTCTYMYAYTVSPSPNQYWTVGSQSLRLGV